MNGRWVNAGHDEHKLRLIEWLQNLPNKRTRAFRIDGREV